MAVTPTSPPPLMRGASIERKMSPAEEKVAKHERLSSFSSLKENSCSDVAQSFIDTKDSSLARTNEEAIEDETPESPRVEIQQASSNMDSLLNPDTSLRGCVCPCGHFKGWKQINVRGKIASKSFSDLRIRVKSWDWETAPEQPVLSPVTTETNKSKDGVFSAGKSPFERLPTEIIDPIIEHLSMDIPPNGFTPRNMDLMALLLTSRTIHSATLATLYKNITIPHSTIFIKFLNTIKKYLALGTMVRRLDFSHFNPRHSGMTARERRSIQNLTSQTLLDCLSLTPNLQEFLAQEHIDVDLSEAVLTKLFNGSLGRLQALDFCACSSANFRDAMSNILSGANADIPELLSITRLSLHECTILNESVFETLLPRLPNLTHLDVAHTRINAKALSLIPHTARLSHLNLSRCGRLSGEAVEGFIVSHPAARDSLVYLNLSVDAKSYEMLSSDEFGNVLKVLGGKRGKKLKSLNLKGSKMTADHVKLLFPLMGRLEELGVGRHLFIGDIITLLRRGRPVESDGEENEEEKAKREEAEKWPPSTLTYLDISDLSTRDLDLSTLFSASTPILTSRSSPLEVLEVNSDVASALYRSPKSCERFGWVVKEAGRRAWLVRDWSKAGVRATSGSISLSLVKSAEEVQKDKEWEDERKTRLGDSGRRDWKMGACYWGMRKVPVARQEVGGMYGLYMFKR